MGRGTAATANQWSKKQIGRADASTECGTMDFLIWCAWDARDEQLPGPPVRSSVFASGVSAFNALVAC